MKNEFHSCISKLNPHYWYFDSYYQNQSFDFQNLILGDPGEQKKRNR